MTPVRIGYGCTLLERALNGGRLDGIGVYAQNLLAELRRRGGITMLPASFPPKPWEKPLSAAFPDSAAFGCAYGLSAALSTVTALPFPGAGGIERRIDVFHAPDHLVPISVSRNGVALREPLCVEDPVAQAQNRWYEL